VVDLLAKAGYRPINIDAIVIAEAPKIVPHFAALQTNLAPILDLPSEAISLKATTSEGMGALGRGEGIGAMCVALIERA